MQSKVLCAKVTEMAKPKADELNIFIWDVEFKKEGTIYCLTVYIDGEDGINIEHCEAVSRYIDPLLDEPEFDSLPQYSLCVSSAGAERKLVKDEHYQYGKGKMITVKFYSAKDGRKTLDGVLSDYDAETITINDEKFDMKDISSINLKLEI